MHKILLTSVIAIFAIAPVFGDYKVPELAEPQDTLNCDATDIGETCASEVENVIATRYSQNGNGVACLDLNGDGACNSQDRDDNVSFIYNPILFFISHKTGVLMPIFSAR